VVRKKTMQDRTKEHSLFIARQSPKTYPLTPAQLKFKKIKDECGIKKGITREELTDKMKNCIPQKWKELKEQEAKGKKEGEV
jgi:hypothetical protein